MERQSASSSSSSPDAGQERVMAAAKHIVKSLAVSKNAADDMMHFLSTFDPRLHPLSSPETGDEAASNCGGDEEEEEIAAAEEIIRRCNSTSSGTIGMADYLYAVDDAIAAAGHSTRAAAAVHAAMPRLEEEARSLLSSSSSLHRRRLSLSSDADVAADASPPSPSPRSPDADAVRAVASRMLRAGYGPELAQVYVSTRRDALAEAVSLLGVEPVAIEEVIRMEWGALDQRMRRWSHAVGAVVGTVLAGERRLCDEVFEPDDEELGHECFADVARGCVLQLLGFADAVAVSASARATERLYRTLGMYEALAAVRHELVSLFSGDDASREFFAGEVSSTVEQLGSALRRTVEEFGHAIHGEASRKAVHGGEIHPMTRYVLNYCGLLADSRATLDAVLGDACLDDDDDDDDDDDTGGAAASTTAAARCIRELLTLLVGKVEEKSRLYDDAGLQNIFLMNNTYYVVQKVRESPPLWELVGDDWLRRHRGQIRQYEAGYLRASWMAVLSTHLRRDGGAGASAAAAGGGHRAAHQIQGPSAKGFNAAFQELYRAQTAWKVTDPQLREELRIAVSERLIPAYRAFLGQGSRHPARHVKWSLEDLEDYMLDFFEGVPKFVRW